MGEQQWPIRTDDDVASLRRAVSQRARELGFGLTALTKLSTAASELSRNVLLHGGGGEAGIRVLRRGAVLGLQVTFRDRGGGIADPERALQSGYSTGRGLGLGLGGAKRLVDEMEIEPRVGGGTVVTVRSWLRRR